MKNIAQQKSELEQILTSESKSALFDLISWLDFECHADWPNLTNFPNQVIARGTAALGFDYFTKHDMAKLDGTTLAAETYALDPTKENFFELATWATGSYPFGPGDGCYCVDQTGYEGNTGSGCLSGSGCLYFGSENPEEALPIIAAELLPWLRGEGDPIAERRRM